MNLTNVSFTGTVEAGSTGWQEVPLAIAAEERTEGLPGAEPPSPQSSIALPALSLPPFGVRIFRHLTP